MTAASIDNLRDRSREKFGNALDGGFQILPDVLLRNQRVLGLDSVDLAIVLNFLMHWWKVDELPFPRMSLIAKRMGVTARTVERRVKELEKRGLIKRLPPQKSKKGLTVRMVDLSGLIDRLVLLADDDPVVITRRYEANEKGRAYGSPSAHSDHV